MTGADVRAAIDTRVRDAQANRPHQPNADWPPPSLRSQVYEVIRRLGPITAGQIDRVLGLRAIPGRGPRCSAVCGALYRANLIRHPGKRVLSSYWEAHTRQ